MSFPLFGETLQFRQPDGTTFTVRAWGDQKGARFETPEGLPVVRDPATRYFHFATPSPDTGALRPSSARVGIEAPLPGDLALGLVAPSLTMMLPPADPVLLRPRWRTAGASRKPHDGCNTCPVG